MALNISTVNQGYDETKGDEEHILLLPGGRQLAYTYNGPTTSRTVVIFFVGIMSVGTSAHVPEPFREK
ncbi:hypothetical protein H0G86_010295 [Trichoderma simmonsii]|uniref:Uncharacterized protein n=1 Tax=Trichoderma simmonsii TaxID=1491479 RepID=A0A8G0LM05_9HYPO|nr:hypothetical protein H0G86_010295 [Trichoderma simmonsii]